MLDTTSPDDIDALIRNDIPGRFNELELIYKQWPRILAAWEGVVLPPYEVLIHPSSSCNLLCDWCIGDHVPIVEKAPEGIQLRVLDASKENSERLPDTLAAPENMQRLIEGIINYRKPWSWREGDTTHHKDFGVEAVSFSGLIGEPFVAKSAMVNAMKMLCERGIRTGVFTNAVLIDDSIIDVLMSLAYVHISVDAATGGTYAKLKFGGRKAGASRFQKAIDNIRQLVECRREKNSTVEITSSYILYPGNYHEVFDAAAMLKEIGVDFFRLKQDISGDRLLSQEEAQETEALVTKIRNELVDENFTLVEIHRIGHLQESQRTFSKCIITDMMAAVGSDGHLYPCNYHPRPGGASYGSAVTSSFQEIWEGERRASTKCSLPQICPHVCDPFKNRSNRLLNTMLAKVEQQQWNADALRSHLMNLHQP